MAGAVMAGAVTASAGWMSDILTPD